MKWGLFLKSGNNQINGLYYLILHFPELQTGKVAGHTSPQVPQLVESVVRFAHVLPQGVLPGVQPSTVNGFAPTAVTTGVRNATGMVVVWTTGAP